MSAGAAELVLATIGNALGATLAWRARLLDAGGALAAAAIGGAALAGLGVGGWLLLVAFFVIGVAVTRLGYPSKAARGLAQSDAGRRRARHVLANGTAPALAALAAAAGGPAEVLAAAFAAAVAAAAADTAASEVGQLAGAPTVLVTSLARVSPGTDGGVSLPGTAAGAAGALAIAGLAAALGLVPRGAWALIAVAGFLGMALDSLLGALLERRGWLNNEAVNLLSTLAAGLGAGLAAR